MTITKKLAYLAALGLTTASVPALAQAVPPATIIVVDRDEVMSTSTAGKAAAAQLQAQVAALQSRAQTLDAGFRSEGDALQKAAATKTMAEAALQAKAEDLQKRAQAAQVDLNNKQRQIAMNQQFVAKQLDDAMEPIITQVMKEKGAMIAIDEGATIQSSNAINVTQTVLQRLNTKLPSVSVNAPAPPPQGR
jgi:Skp family chaperone for outer membrane proteins